MNVALKPVSNDAKRAAMLHSPHHSTSREDGAPEHAPGASLTVTDAV
jgi:hypothetical protein